MSPTRRLALGFLSWGALATLAAGQPLVAPAKLRVTVDGSVYRGRWDSVPGASHYEVWMRLYGNWKHNEKDPESSPFTSSFDIPGSDDRALFKVRAVSADGAKGPFSEEAQATPAELPRPGAGPSSGAGRSDDGFDPEAPPPAAPSSLFAVWGDPREIRLVWQASEKATRYTVEEFKDEKWVSVTKIEFVKDTTAVLKDRPMPGPYQFRVRAIGRNGRASEPSRPTVAKR